MADTTIETRLTLTDKMTAGINRAAGAVGDLSKHFFAGQNGAQNLQRAVGGLQGGLLSLSATIGGVGLLQDVLKINEEFENTSIKIAGTLKAFNLAPTIEMAQEQAKSAMTIIQDMAAALPGETEEYINVFSTALPKAIEAGMRDISQIATFTSKWMALASSNTIDAMQAGMDLYRVLSGQAGADVRMWSVLQSQVGMTTDAFNKLAKTHPDQIVSKLTDVLKKYDDQQGLAAESFSAKMGEFQSRFKELKRLASAALFEKAKDSLNEINAYLRDNKDKLVATGKAVFDKVIPVLRTMVDLFKLALNNINLIVAAVGSFVAIWVAGTAAAAILNIVSLYREMRTVILAATVAQNALNASQAGGLAGRLGVSAGAAGGIIGVGVAAMGGALLSTIDSMKESQKAAAAGQAQAYEIQKTLPEARSAAQFFGAIRGMEMAKRPAGAPELTPAELMEATAAYDKARRLSPMVSEKFIGALQKYEQAAGLTQSAVDLEAYRRAYAGPAVAPSKAPDKRTEQKFDFRNSRFDIKQNFAEGFDPDRIAVAFASDLGRLGEMKTQSGYVHTATVR